MTREEAIAILRQDREGICTDIQCTMTMYRDYSGVDKCNQDCEEREAYDMAIEALQAEPVKHGEWEEKETYLNEGDCEITEWQSARCSKCGKYHTTPYMYSFDNFNFCPNCGAKMTGE